MEFNVDKFHEINWIDVSGEFVADTTACHVIYVLFTFDVADCAEMY